MFTKKQILWGIGIAAVLLIIFGRFYGGPIEFISPPDEGSPITLGVLLPLTGDAASYGESENRAVQVAVEEINAAGGIAGREVQLILEDGKCDPQAGGTAAQKLVNVDKVKVIIGGACSGETLAAAEVAEPAKVILISPSASSPKVTEAGDFVFRTYPSDALAGRIAAKYAVEKLGAKTAAVVTELTDYSQGLREVFKSTFTELKGEIVTDETYTTGDTDFRTQVTKIKAAGPDVIYVVPQTLTPGVAILKQLREAGVKAQFMTAEVLLDRTAVKDNAQALESVIGVEPAVDWEGNAKAKAFRDAHRAKYDGADPGSFSANAYDAVYLIAAAIEEVGLDTEAIRDFLYGVKDWPGAVGSLTMDSNGDPILGLNVRKIADGAVTDLGPYAP
jgi:branched-chain amino acid transport system substrate-binding protein